VAVIRLQREDFDIAAEQRALLRGRTDVGAVVTFTGICRGGEGMDAISAMTLEHYPGMAEEEIARHVATAERRWPLQGVVVVHRYGRLTPGDNIVLVIAAMLSRRPNF
jgi:molybdopterin synthase catalytic subunit